MMNLYRPSNRNTNSRRRLLAATVIVLCVFLLDVSTHGEVRHVVRTGAAKGLQVTSSIFSTVGRSAFFSSKATLERTIIDQQQQIAHLQEIAGSYTVVKQENDELRALVRLSQATPGITAPIVSSLRASPYGTFYVGAGSADGIAKGNLVVSEGGFVVGRISDVDAHTSLVSQLFTSGSSIDGLIGEAAVVVEGMGGGNARAKIPHGIVVHDGDPVLAPSLRGRSIGIVGKVASSSASAASDAYIGLPVNLTSLLFVHIEQ